MPSLNTIAAIGMPVIDTTGYSPTSTVGLLADCLSRCKTILAEYQAKAASIRTSDVYTDVGRRQQLASLYADAMARLSFDAVMNQARTQQQALRQGISDKVTVVGKNPNGTNDDAAVALREIEVRQKFVTLDDQDRVTVFLDAVKTGDALTFNAVRNAPAFFELLAPDIVAAGENQWAKQHSPQAAKELDDLTRAINMLVNAVRDTRQYIADDAGVKADPLDVIANSGPVLSGMGSNLIVADAEGGGGDD